MGAGDWANISDRIYDRSEISITRGLQNEDGTAGPGSMSLSLKNDDGLFAVRNPESPLFNLLGRNAPLRLTYGRGKYGMVLGQRLGFTNGRAQCPDTAGLSSGDLDIRFDMELLPRSDGVVSGWTSGLHDIASHLDFTVNNLDWSLMLINGVLRFRWFPTGTTPGLSADCTVPFTTGSFDRRSIRVTLQLSTGQVVFYTATSVAGPWTIRGSAVTLGATSRFNSAAPLRIGAASQQGAYPYIVGTTDPCVHYKSEIRQGINGTVVASPDFTSRPLDAEPFSSSAFTDAQGNGWIFSGSSDASRIWYGDIDYRHTGEIASLPNRFSVGLHDKWVPVTSNGVLRRYGQGKAPTSSGLRDFTLAHPNQLAAYYPLSGEEGTIYSVNISPGFYYLKTQFYAVGVSGIAPVFKYGVDMGSSTVGTGLEINATGISYMHGEVGSGLQNAAFDFVFQSSGLGVLTAQIQDYSLNLWAVTLNTSTDDGTAQVTFTDPSSGPVGFAVTAALPELQDGAIHHCRLQITTTGPDSAYKLFIDGVQVASGNNPGYIWRGTSVFRLFYSRYVNQTYVNVAHLTLWHDAVAANIPTAADVTDAVFGYAGDTAADRMSRVAADGGIPITIIGDPATTMPMGVLNNEPRLAQIRDAETADMGILHEARDSVSLLYRTRRSMVGQAPDLVLEFDGGHIMQPFEPLDDDQQTRNDVTANRRGGGSAEIIRQTGRLSVLDPPLGVGLYDDEVTVNVQTDGLLPGVAAWLVNLGTLDKARYPAVSVELAADEVDPTLTAAVYAADVGDALRITGASGIGEYDDMDLIIVGYQETIGQVTGDGKRKSLFTFVCRPGDLYKAATYSTSRYDTGGSTLVTGVSATATSLSIATVAGQAVWSTTAEPYDLWMDGERITVTAMTGATSPQTATVVRSVNGVVKAQKAGATVRLFDTPRYTL